MRSEQSSIAKGDDMLRKLRTWFECPDHTLSYQGSRSCDTWFGAPFPYSPGPLGKGTCGDSRTAYSRVREYRIQSPCRSCFHLGKFLCFSPCCRREIEVIIWVVWGKFRLCLPHEMDVWLRMDSDLLSCFVHSFCSKQRYKYTSEKAVYIDYLYSFSSSTKLEQQ